MHLLQEMLTYKRASDSPSEQAFIARFLDPVPGMHQDGFGNRYLRLGDQPTTLFSAHTDSVHLSSGRQPAKARTLHRAGGACYPVNLEGPWPEPSPAGAPPLTTVVYFHGFASGPQGPSPKIDLIRDLGYAVALIATDGDYRPAGYRAAFARLGLDPAAPVVLMGTSLGGFWARRLGQELGRPWLALNPAIQPSVTLRRYLGPNTRFDTGGAFLWTAADCEAYVAEEHFPLRPDVPGLLICAADDEVLDYRVARDAAATAQVLVLPGGGHQLHNTGDYGEAVGAFLAAVTDQPCRGDTLASFRA